MADTTKPNYSTQFLSVPIKYGDDPSRQLGKIREEEKGHRAPQEMPYNLSQSQEVLSRIYSDLLNLKSMVNKAKNDPEIDTDPIYNINDLIDKMSSMILIDVSNELDKLAL
jgi:hypothetical protein